MALITDQIKLNPKATGSLPSGSEGSLAYDSTDNILKQYDSSWKVAGGKVLQVKQELSGDYGCTGPWGGSGISSYTYTGKSVSITPLSTTSKIYGEGVIACGSDTTVTSGPQHYYIILRGVSNNNGDPMVSTQDSQGRLTHYLGRSLNMRFDDYWNFPIKMYDSAHGQGSGSAVNYRLYFKAPGNTMRGSGFDLTMWEIEG